MVDLNSEDQFKIDPSKLPKQLDIDLPPEVAAQLEEDAAEVGRSVDELILDILDRYLQDH